MADNFDMKKFLMENKLGAYSKLRTEGEAAYEYEKGKAAGEKLAKEDIGGDIGDAEAEKMMDFLAEEEPLKEDASVVMDLLGLLAGLAGMGLTGAQILRWQNKLEKENPELYKQLGQVSTTIGGADPSKNLEEKKEDLNEDASVVMNLLGTLAGLAGIGLTGVQILKWQNKLEKENPELYKQLGQVSTTIGGADPSKNLEEVKEALSPEAFERMDGLVSQSDIMEYLRAAERIANTLSDDGFEARDIFDYLHQLVINDL